MIDPEWAKAFAAEWISAWNAADLPRILSHYVDDFEMSSPLIIERMGLARGRLKGKSEIAWYWTLGLAAKPPLTFELIDVLTGVDVIAIYYRSTTRRRIVIEHLKFNGAGLVVSGEALYRPDI